MSGATSEEGNDEAPQVQPQPPPPAATKAHPQAGLNLAAKKARLRCLPTAMEPDDILVNILDRLYIWVQPECLTKGLAHVFHRLKIVNLVNIPEGYDLTWTMFIVEAAPSLEEVYMTVIDHPCEMQTDKKRRAYFYSENKGVEWESSTSNSKHHRLTKLIIFCFESEVYMVSLVRRVLKAAVNLKDVYLYNRLACRKCVPMEKPTRFPQTEKQRCSAKNLLTEGIESPARIHFLDPAEASADHNARIPVAFSGSLCNTGLLEYFVKEKMVQTA